MINYEDIKIRLV